MIFHFSKYSVLYAKSLAEFSGWKLRIKSFYLVNLLLLNFTIFFLFLEKYLITFDCNHKFIREISLRLNNDYVSAIKTNKFLTKQF